MKEKQVQAKFIDKILSENQGISHDDFLICSELKFGEGKRKADLAVMTEKKFTAYEIKTQFDTLMKLPGQLESYYEAFDYVYLIVGKNHLKLAKSLAMPTTGIFIIEDSEFVLHKKAKKNKDSTKEGTLSFLTKTDLAFLTHHFGLNTAGLSKLPKEEIKKHLLERKSLAKIKSETAKLLFQKYSPRFKEFIRERGEITIEEDLLILSNDSGF